MLRNSRFRRLLKIDLETRRNALNDERVSKGMLIEVPVSAPATERWYDEIQHDESRRDFALISDGEAVGFSGIVNLDQRNGTAELYIFVVPEAQRNGLGTKLLSLTLAFATFELHARKITLYVTSTNECAARFYERFGFKREGTLMRHVWRQGSYCDRWIYSIFLDEHVFDKAALYGSLS